MMRRPNRIALLIVGVAMVPLVWASTAWACQVLATLQASPNPVAAGASVTATGGNYSASPSASNVDIHLDTRGGAVLASTKPGAADHGAISVTFNIPANVKAGYHTLIATQTINGVPKSGTPGRAALHVTAGAVATGSVVNPSALANPLVTGPVVLVLAGFGLFALKRRQSASASA